MILANGEYNVKLKRFNKYLNRYKLLSIIILFLIIVTTLIYYSNVRYESSVSFRLINEKNVQDIIDELLCKGITYIKYDIIVLGRYRIIMSKYVRVMDGLKSNAGGFEYKLDEVNVADNWNPNSLNLEEMGGFNFGTEDKILRWLHRGDTLYDVIIPDDAEVYNVDEEKGIYRSNKIIVSNPRKLTDKIIIDLYKKSTLSDKIIAQCLMVLIWKDKLEVAKYIIKDRVNKNNINLIFEEFTNYAGEKNLSYEGTQTIYNILKEIQSSTNIN